MPHATKSALQDAREAFVAGLARRAEALRPVVDSFIADPGARVVRAELQRRLHSLLASAQLFEEPGLVGQLQALTTRLDAVGLASDAWNQTDSDRLLGLLSSLHPHGVKPPVSGVAPAASSQSLRPSPRDTHSEPVLRAASEPVLARSAANDRTSMPAPVRHAERPPAPSLASMAPVVPTHQIGAVMLVRVLLVCSRPHAAELRSLLDEAPLELLHAADPEQALKLVERCSPAYALIAAEFATLPDIDLVRRLREDPLHPVEGVYLMLPQGATYDADFVRQTGADGVLIEPVSWEMLGPLLDRAAPGFDPDEATEPSPKPVLIEPEREAEAEKVMIEPLQLVAAPVDKAVEAHQPPAPAPSATSAAAEPAKPKVTLDGGLTEAFAQAHSAADRAQKALLESGRVPVSAPRTPERVPSSEHSANVLAQLQAVRAQAAQQRASLLPAAERAASMSPPRSAPQTQTPAAKGDRSLLGRRILIVDDDPAMLWFFSGVVRDAGGEALQARDGAEALELARRKRPQLVLSDILMPKLDGFALRRSLVRDLWLERTPVLLLSWKGDPVDDSEARPANAAGSLRKEASVPEVLAAIERALAPRQQLEQALLREGEVTGRVEDLGIVSLFESVVAARSDVRLIVEDAADLFEVDIADANQIAVTRTAADGGFTRAERALIQLIGVTQGRFRVQKRSGSLRSPVQLPLKTALSAAVSEVSALIEALSAERIEQVTRLTFDEEMLSPRLKETPAWEPIVSALRALSMNPRQAILDDKLGGTELSQCLMQLGRQGVVTGIWGHAGQDLLGGTTRLQSSRPAPSLPPALPPPTASIAPPSPKPEPVAEVSEPAPPPEAAIAARLVSMAPPPPAATSIPAAKPEASAEPVPPAAAVVAAPTQPRGALAELQESVAAVAAREREAALIQPVTIIPEPDPYLDREDDYDDDPVSNLEFRSAAEPVVVETTFARWRRREPAVLAATLAASAVLGYVVALQIETHPVLLGRSAETIGERGLDTPLSAAKPSETSVRSGLDPSQALGTVLPYIDTTRGVPVGNDEGLVIFEYVGALPIPKVEIDGRVLGSPPLAVALAANPHQLKLWLAGESTLRTLSVRAGETRVITLPLPKP
jgi:CheY-like chemotaxis protein